ncbi:CHASE2 domain-containing protein [Luteimonas sp. A649]
MRSWSLQGVYMRILAGAAGAAAVAVLTLTPMTWRADAWVYDRLQAAFAPAADDRILLVTVDDRSLSALGRWPWPRGVHAALLDRLEPAGVRGIALDLMFAEANASDPSGDAALARAIRRNGKVILPVMAEPSGPEGPLIEQMPLPPLIDAAAALGHVEVAAGSDGVVREAALYAGLGSAHWPALALALHELHAGVTPRAELPGLRPGADAPSPSPYQWSRDHRVMIPFVSTRGFQKVSYIDVLRGEVLPALLHDRWVLVGVSATGIARDVLVPGVGVGERISGLEYHANALNMLEQGTAVTALQRPWQLLLGAGVLLLPLLLYRERARVRRGWVVVLLAILATFAASTTLLKFGQAWFAPAPTVAVLLAGYLALVVHQFLRSQRLASSDGLTRLANRHMFDATLERELRAARRAGRPLSLLLVDVDHFKTFNDSYGHQAGDQVMRRVSGVLDGWARRPRDMAARYGGDELALVLPESTAAAALGIANSIVADVRRLKVPHGKSPTAAIVSVSIGIATFDPALHLQDIDLVERADAALYTAKREGRNRALCATAAQAAAPQGESAQPAS